MNVRARISIALLAAASLAMGCSGGSSSPDGGGDAGTGPGHDGGGKTDGGSGTDGGVDAGTDAGPSGCLSDSDCLPTGLRCSPDGGCTLPASSCNPSEGSDNCAGTVNYCYTDGISTTNNCYCDPLGDGGGVCYVQTPPCGPCASQLECGPASQVNNPGYCGQVGTQGTFCLPLDTGGNCDPGFLPGTVSGTNVCVPSCGACPCSACTSDSDCPLPAVGVCNENNGACEPPCQVQADCATGDVCNVLGKYLDPTLGTLYAAGQCGPPCGQASDCTIYQDDDAGVPYFCDLDAGAICRPTGCLQDGECEQPGLPDGSVIAWCDIWDGNVCVGDVCRIGDNPVGGAPFNDCIGGYTCYLPDGGAPAPTLPDGGPPIHGACLPIPCNEITGGAHDDCNAGQLCCGEGDGGTDCGGAAVGACYAAPSPPWCVACDTSNGNYFNSACSGVDDGYPGAVACLTSAGLGAQTSWCGPPCDPNQLWTCPAAWSCTEQQAIFTDCSSCAECLDAGQLMGTQIYQCGCGSDAGCPAVPEGSGSGSVQTQCVQSICILGYNCTTRDGCPDAG
jgi:hypothetical protein